MASNMTEYRKRRLMMVEYLGAKCAQCDKTEGLQFDHVDPNSKCFDVSKNWARAWVVLVVELDKCQLLCNFHHKAKGRMNKEYGGGDNRWKSIKHGTIWAYSKYKCRCAECKRAKSISYYENKPD